MDHDGDPRDRSAEQADKPEHEDRDDYVADLPQVALAGRLYPAVARGLDGLWLLRGGSLRLLRVRKSVKAVPLQANPGERRRWVLQLENLKTDKSKRTIKLPGKVAEALKALRAAQAADRLRLGPYYGGEYGDLGLVFCTSAGQPMRLDSANAKFKKVCAAAGIGSGWVPYEQRHTFASVLSDSGVDIELIADAMGHVNSSVTRTVYRHQIADKVAQAAAVMDSIFGSA